MQITKAKKDGGRVDAGNSGGNVSGTTDTGRHAKVITWNQYKIEDKLGIVKLRGQVTSFFDGQAETPGGFTGPLEGKDPRVFFMNPYAIDPGQGDVTGLKYIAALASKLEKCIDNDATVYLTIDTNSGTILDVSATP